MQILIALAHCNRPKPSAEELVDRLKAFYQPALGRSLAGYSRQSEFGTIIYLEVPQTRCRWSFVQEDDETYTASCGYPRYWSEMPGRDSANRSSATALPALCRRLQDSPGEVRRNLCPPFFMAWIDKVSGNLYVGNDGLGLADAYELNSAHTNAWANKVFALPLVSGEPLQPAPEEWQMKLGIGYFPGNLSGFHSVSSLPPGLLTRVGLHGLHSSCDPTGGDVLRPDDGDTSSSIDSCNDALKRSIADALDYWDDASFDLSGGLDSRAVAATALTVRRPIRLRTMDRAGGNEVRVARELAKRAGLTVEHEINLLPRSDGVLSTMEKCVSWTGGGGYLHVPFQQFHTIDPEAKALRVGGMFGELLRGYFYKHVRSGSDSLQTDVEIAGELAATLVHACPIADRETLHAARELIKSRCLLGREAGLHGLSLCEYAYLMIKVRRWGAAATSGMAGQTQIMPVLSPFLLRAVFALPPDEKRGGRLIRTLIDRNAPEWRAMKTARKRFKGSTLIRRIDRCLWMRPCSGQAYDQDGYLINVAGESIDSILDEPSSLVASAVDVPTAAKSWKSFRKTPCRDLNGFGPRFIWNLIGLQAVEGVLRLQQKLLNSIRPGGAGNAVGLSTCRGGNLAKW